MAWLRERVWVDPFKIGKVAVFEKVATRFSKRKTKRPVSFDCFIFCLLFVLEDYYSLFFCFVFFKYFHEK